MSEPDTLENVASWTVRILAALALLSVILRRCAALMRAANRVIDNFLRRVLL